MKAECARISPRAIAEDELLTLELKIARRADELSRSSLIVSSPKHDRETWHQAEYEFLNSDAHTITADPLTLVAASDWPLGPRGSDDPVWVDRFHESPAAAD